MIGIYKITNLVNNKFYIGSSKNLKYRWAAHLCQLRKNRHNNTYLQNSFNLYGEKNFKFESIEECLITELITKEQYWVDKLLPEYNIRKRCESNLGFKHTETTKTKISKKSKQLWERNKNKMIESIQKPILSYNKQGHFIKEYKSVKEAAKDLGVSGTNISTVLKGKNGYMKGFHFIYKIEPIPQKLIPPKRRNNGRVGVCNREKVELWLDDKLIGQFNSKTDVAKYIGTNCSTTSQIISGKYFKEHPKTKIPKYVIKKLI